MTRLDVGQLFMTDIKCFHMEIWMYWGGVICTKYLLQETHNDAAATFLQHPPTSPQPAPLHQRSLSRTALPNPGQGAHLHCIYHPSLEGSLGHHDPGHPGRTTAFSRQPARRPVEHAPLHEDSAELHNGGPGLGLLLDAPELAASEQNDGVLRPQWHLSVPDLDHLAVVQCGQPQVRHPSLQ